MSVAIWLEPDNNSIHCIDFILFVEFFFEDDLEFRANAKHTSSSMKFRLLEACIIFIISTTMPLNEIWFVTKEFEWRNSIRNTPDWMGMDGWMHSIIIFFHYFGFSYLRCVLCGVWWTIRIQLNKYLLFLSLKSLTMFNMLEETIQALSDSPFNQCIRFGRLLDHRASSHLATMHRVNWNIYLYI